MYLSYFGFKDHPFSVTPDPAFLYLSASHREALGHLLYGAGEHGGFVALTGEVGTGKTTLIRAVMADEIPDLDIALCWNPHLGTHEFVATICDELGVAYEPSEHASLKSLVDRLNAHLLSSHAKNRRTVLVVDEAQNLSRDVLEQLRLLTNLETHKVKLLRIILVGQPELTDLLNRYDLRQLAQRITARFHLTPLGLAETRAYIQHRLQCAQGPQHLFSGSAVLAVRLLTGGVPRLINTVCERALMGGYAHERSHIGPITVVKASMETLPGHSRFMAIPRVWRNALTVAALLAVLLLVGSALMPTQPLARIGDWWQGMRQPPSAAHVAVVAATPAQNGMTENEPGAAGDEAPSASGPSGQVSTNKTGQPSAVESSGHTGAEDATETKVKDDQGLAVSSSSGGEQTTGAAASAAPDEQGIPMGDADINQLLRLWGVFGAQVRSGCANLQVGDLRCLSDNADFATLERYNRPALLVLSRDGQQQTVLLSAINADNVTLVGSDGTRQVSRSQLAGLWTGRFQMVWRSDSGVGLIQPGAVGDAVVWLRRRLLQVQGKNPDAQIGRASPIYDDALEQRLKAFQQRHGLTPDGMAGPRTQMMLNGAVPSPGAPTLRAVAS